MTENDSSREFETATLGGGCFWCLEAVFQELEGVEDVRSGYAGGHVASPTYRQVCTGTTGHAEVVQVRYDPAAVSFREILAVFFTIHDPTTKDREGNDVGPQYRSAVFWHDDEQRRVTGEVMEELAREGVYDDPLVTEVAPLDTFWPAEAEHEDYFRRNPGQTYCRLVIDPKVRKFRERFAGKRKKVEERR